VGAVLAELVQGGRSSTPIEAFSIARFVAPKHPKAAYGGIIHP
jgi:hypothetical protein